MPNAPAESQFKPPGLLLDVYRVAIRKHQHREWSLALHDGPHLGAAAMASTARASMEFLQDQGRRAMLAFLDCRKSKLGPSHGRDPNQVEYMHLGGRHVKAHGAVARMHCCEGSPQAFLAEPLQQCPLGKPRDYVGDVTLQIDAEEPGVCAKLMGAALTSLRAALDADNVVLNDSEQQVLGST